MSHYGYFVHAKLIIMAHINTYKLKVAFRKYGKHFNVLTPEQKKEVTKIVYEQY
tara:strand:- start:146 stop:307 length:162 start_codon:yes stop_codon:yes gene_type:complete